jgi:hypothetical protein
MPIQLRKTCQNLLCGKIFIVPYKKRSRRYCSYPCSHLSIEQRLWDKIQICSHGKDCIYCCFPWQGGRDRNNYATLWVRKDDVARPRYAARLLWEIFNCRPMPPKHLACHHCDSPPCMNPMHIYSGTHKMNSQDAVRRARFKRRRRGEACPNAILRTHNIAEIFRWRQEGHTISAIAQTLHVSVGTIAAILHYRRWTHVSRSLSAAPVTSALCANQNLGLFH